MRQFQSHKCRTKCNNLLNGKFSHYFAQHSMAATSAWTHWTYFALADKRNKKKNQFNKFYCIRLCDHIVCRHFAIVLRQIVVTHVYKFYDLVEFMRAWSFFFFTFTVAIVPVVCQIELNALNCWMRWEILVCIIFIYNDRGLPTIISSLLSQKGIFSFERSKFYDWTPCNLLW